MILESIAMMVATLFAGHSLTQGDPDWHDDAGQEHHAIGRAFIYSSYIGISLIILTGIMSIFIAVQYSWIAPYFVMTLFAYSFGNFSNSLG